MILLPQNGGFRSYVSYAPDTVVPMQSTPPAESTAESTADKPSSAAARSGTSSGPSGGAPFSLPFTMYRVDRQDARRRDEGWLESVWSLPGTQVLRISGSAAFMRDGALVWEAPAGPVPPDAIYLGSAAGAGSRPQHLVAVPAEADQQGDAGSGEVWADLREVAQWLGDLDAAAFAEAVALTRWHRDSGFCPRCGTATELRNSGWMKWCPGCSTEHFPRTDPAVITAVVDAADRILLGSAHRWGPDRYSTFAGFVEAGESLEQAVIREVAEEAGVEVADPQYLGSQPWPFPRSLMLGYIAQATDPAAALADGEEIRHVRWFTREELAGEAAAGEVWLPSRASISRALIEYWFGGRIAEPATESPLPPVWEQEQQQEQGPGPDAERNGR